MVTTSALDFPLLKDASVLVVDDVPVNVQLLSIILRKAGCRVRSASTAAAARAILEKEPQDAAILDVMMPDVNGYELCQQIRADPRHGNMPVLFISSLGAASDKVRGFAAGGADYVTKPFLAEEVLARIEHHIKLARLHCELVSEKQSLARANQELLRAQRQTAELFGTVSELLPGRILDDRYRLEQKIGSGGFGVVFRATHLSLQRQVALKVFRPSTHWASESALRRFLKEGAAMGSLDHAHVVQVFDTAISREGLAYLVMELLEGRTLAAEIRRVRRMTWEW